MEQLNTINKAIGKYRWTICTLLFFATTINYLDRQVLSLLKDDLSLQFDWTEADYGRITGVFTFVYAISMLFAGRLIDYLGTRRGYAWSIIVWSVGAMVHALSRGTAGFMVARGVLGVGESGNFPAAIKATAEWFPKKERALATGIFNSGSNIGAILAPLTVPFIAAAWGWQMAFIIIGGIGFLWLVAWLLIYGSPLQKLQKGQLSQGEYDYINADQTADQAQADQDAKRMSWGKLLTFRQTWAFVVGKFMTDGVWWFLLFWLPAFMSAQYGMSTTQIAIPLAVLYTMTCVGSIGGGWFPKVFINRGMEPYMARMRAMFIIALCPLFILSAQWLGGYNYWFAVIAIGIGASAHQAWSANLFTTVSDMFPKKAVASVVGLGGMAGGLGGVLINVGAGYIFDYWKAAGSLTTGYTIVFLICALAYLIAWSAMKILVPRFKEIKNV
ncbi:MAG: MFS transporter [Mucinivorans sp.]